MKVSESIRVVHVIEEPGCFLRKTRVGCKEQRPLPHDVSRRRPAARSRAQIPVETMPRRWLLQQFHLGPRLLERVHGPRGPRTAGQVQRQPDPTPLRARRFGRQNQRGGRRRGGWRAFRVLGAVRGGPRGEGAGTRPGSGRQRGRSRARWAPGDHWDRGKGAGTQQEGSREVLRRDHGAGTRGRRLLRGRDEPDLPRRRPRCRASWTLDQRRIQVCHPSCQASRRVVRGDGRPGRRGRRAAVLYRQGGADLLHQGSGWELDRGGPAGELGGTLVDRGRRGWELGIEGPSTQLHRHVL